MTDTRRIVVDINPKLHAKFTRVVNEIGSKKKFALVKMIEDFVLNAEENPTYFKWLKKQREGATRE